MTRATATVIVWAISALVLLPSSASAAGLKAIWGPSKLADQTTSAFGSYEALGVDVLQLQIDWAAIAPQEPAAPTDPADPAYNWSGAFGNTIAEAATHNIDIALLVKGTPAWAVSNPSSGPPVATRKPDDVGDYADFLTAVSAKYPLVRRWMIWGETNRQAVWSSGPSAYADLLDAAYGALKTASASNVVVGGMTFTYGEPSPAAWIGAMKRTSGQRPRLDEYGHNPFTHRCPDLSQGPASGARDISDIDTLIGEARSAFGQSTKLWLSEFTVGSDRPSRAFGFFVSRVQQADWLRKAYAIAGSASYVSGLGWFNLYDESPSVADGLTTGLTTFAGEHKPAWDAYVQAKLDGSSPRVPCPRPPAPPSPPKPPPAPPPPPPPPSLELVAPKTGSLRKMAKSGYRMKVRCGRRCKVSASLLLRPADAHRLGLKRKAVRIAGKRIKLAAGKTAPLRLKLTRKAVRQLKRLGNVKLTVELVSTDSAGTHRIRRTLRLRR